MSKCVLKFVKFVRLKSRCDMHISRGKHNKSMQNPFTEKKYTQSLSSFQGSCVLLSLSFIITDNLH